MTETRGPVTAEEIAAILGGRVPSPYHVADAAAIAALVAERWAERERALTECNCGARLTGLPNVGLIHGVTCPRGLAERERSVEPAKPFWCPHCMVGLVGDEVTCDMCHDCREGGCGEGVIEATAATEREARVQVLVAAAEEVLAGRPAGRVARHDFARLRAALDGVKGTT